MDTEKAAQMRALARWLDDHHDLVTVPDLAAMGFSAKARRRLVAEGRLYRGAGRVLVGSRRPSPARDLHMAWLATGGIVSHLSAAWWQGLVGGAPSRPHITIDPSRRLRAAGLILHRAVTAGECCRHRGLTVTVAERTVLDLASHAGLRREILDSAIDRAVTEGLTTTARLMAIAAPTSTRRRHGAPRLRTLLAERGHLDGAQASILEKRMARLLADLCRRHELDEPVSELSVQDGQYRLDYAWPCLLLAIEVDGFTWHHHPDAMEHDDDRRNELVGVGWAFQVFTWRMVAHSPDLVADRVLTAYREAERQLTRVRTRT